MSAKFFRFIEIFGAEEAHLIGNMIDDLKFMNNYVREKITPEYNGKFIAHYKFKNLSFYTFNTKVYAIKGGTMNIYMYDFHYHGNWLDHIAGGSIRAKILDYICDGTYCEDNLEKDIWEDHIYIHDALHRRALITTPPNQFCAKILKEFGLEYNMELNKIVKL